MYEFGKCHVFKNMESGLCVKDGTFQYFILRSIPIVWFLISYIDQLLKQSLSEYKTVIIYLFVCESVQLLNKYDFIEVTLKSCSIFVCLICGLIGKFFGEYFKASEVHQVRGGNIKFGREAMFLVSPWKTAQLTFWSCIRQGYSY